MGKKYLSKLNDLFIKDEEARESLSDFLKKMNEIAQRITNIEKTIQSINQIVGSTRQNVGTLNQNVGSLNQSVGVLNQNMGSLDLTAKSLSQSVTSIRESANNLVHRIDNIEYRVGNIEQGITNAPDTPETNDISFYLYDTKQNKEHEFACVDGMTWGEFITSEYNPDGTFYLHEGIVYSTSVPVWYSVDGGTITSTDKISNTHTYYTVNSNSDTPVEPVMSTISGEYLFNDIVSFPDTDMYQQVNFSTPGGDMIEFGILSSGSIVYRNEAGESINVYRDGFWLNNEYKHVIFGVDSQDVYADFANFVRSNARENTIDMITFYMNDYMRGSILEFKCPRGMTWYEYFNSEYCNTNRMRLVTFEGDIMYIELCTDGTWFGYNFPDVSESVIEEKTYSGNESIMINFTLRGTNYTASQHTTWRQFIDWGCEPGLSYDESSTFYENGNLIGALSYVETTGNQVWCVIGDKILDGKNYTIET